MGCRYCSFDWDKLKEMKDAEVEFWAGDGFNRLRIIEVSDRTKTVHMINQTGKITWPLDYAKLEEIHNKIHDGEVRLIPFEIDKLAPAWGNYITGLMKYLGCDEVTSSRNVREDSMAIGLDPQQVFSFEELQTSQEALARLLMKKGIFTKEELSEMAKVVDQERKRDKKKTKPRS